MDPGNIYQEIISYIFSTPSETIDIQKIKIDFCRKYGIISIPKNSQLLAVAPDEYREKLRKILLLKPTRTLSGVAPIAVMTSPYPCPHGKCLPCPGGPKHPFKSPQSYTGEEPAALRGKEHNFNPYQQVYARLDQLRSLGHHIDKVELIVMGGTMTARPYDYQEWFVKRSIQSMNEYYQPKYITTLKSWDDVAEENEYARIRCVAITFETRPDWCKREHIDSMLSLGVTKVELGVQHIDDKILSINNRGCYVCDTINANKLLRDAGLKVGFHIMPNLPGSTIEKDKEMFRKLFEDSQFKPDFLKIYPTLVTPQSEIERLWNNGDYRPYTEEELVDLIAYAKSLIPEYVRLQRVQRDIPAKLIVAGSKHSNFRQIAKKRLEEWGKQCRCIRCREVGRVQSTSQPQLQDMSYDCCGGKEHFISEVAGDALIGFARVRFPRKAYSPCLQDAALLRELHIYGEIVPIGKAPTNYAWQHKRHGEELLQYAEMCAESYGYSLMAVMSGIGVRSYYRRHGYSSNGPYMVKRLS